MTNLLARTKTSFIITITFLTFLLLPPIFFSAFFLVLLCYVLYFEWSVICIKQPLFYFLTPLYPILPFFLLMQFSLAQNGKEMIAFLFLFTSFFDMACYFVGSLFGKTPLLPTISPKKTVEGFLGGVCIILVISFIFMQLLQYKTDASFWTYIIGMIFVVTAGDLFESWIKRCSRVKDSGDLLPGHGGILDRVDSLLFVVIYFYCIKDWFLSCVFC